MGKQKAETEPIWYDTRNRKESWSDNKQIEGELKAVSLMDPDRSALSLPTSSAAF